MSWSQGIALVAATLVITACSSEPTGVHVTVHLGGIACDELRFGVVEPGVNGGATLTLVDPETAGRKTGPFRGADQNVVILLRDDVGGREIFCDVAALSNGVTTGSGAGAVLAQAHQIRDIDIFMEGGAPDDGGAPGDGPTDRGTGGTGGAAGTGGRSGGGTGIDGGPDGRGGGTGTGGNTGGGAGAGGTGGARGGAGGGTPGTGTTGAVCTRDTECATLHCVDGVCCESACDTACSTCNRNAGQAGQCRLVMNRMPDPRGLCVDTGAASCGTNGLCDAQGQCLRYPFGTICPPPCADAQDRFTTGICSVTNTCLGLAPVACPAPARSCVAGACL